DVAAVLVGLEAGLNRTLPLAGIAQARARLRGDERTGQRVGGRLEQADGVDAAIVRVAAEALVALSHLDRDGVLANARVTPRRQTHRSARRLHLDDVAGIYAQAVGRGRVDLHPRRPAELADRIRQLLEPRAIREPPVEE